MKDIVIVDIDGTLTKVGKRKKCLEKDPKDWDEFYSRCGEDKPILGMATLIGVLASRYHICFCTGRRESTRDMTSAWLFKNGFTEYCYNMLMRPNGDHRHDTILKPELLKKSGMDLSKIAFVLEDRDAMVKTWREMGLICLQVAEGNF